MKYEIGDKIIVMHSGEEGKVVDIINDQMVMIEIRGVKFPAYMDQIDFPYFTMFSNPPKPVEKKSIYVDQVKREKQPRRKKTRDGVEVSFFPILDKDIFDDDVVEKLKVFLVNHNEEAYNFKYNLVFGPDTHFQLNTTIEGLSDFYLHDVQFEDMNDNPRFEFEFSLSKPDKKKAPYYEAFLKLRAKQLFKRIEEVQQKNEASFSFPLFTHYPDKIVENKLDLGKLNNAGFRMYDVTKGSGNLASARSVVDLHLDKIIQFPNEIAQEDILDYQLKTFEKYYDLAVAHKQHKLIIIHGIGEGTLKNALHERLKLKNEVSSFVNQYHHQYGYGATEIFLKFEK